MHIDELLWRNHRGLGMQLKYLVKLVIVGILSSTSAVALSQATPAVGGDVAANAARFGAMEAVEDIALSPNGSQIAFLSPSTAMGNDLYVVGTGEGAQPRRILRASGAPERLNWCRFKTEARIICRMSGRAGVGASVFGFSRLVALDAAGGNVIALSTDRERPAYGGQMVDWLPDDPEHVLILNPAGNLVRVNVTNDREEGVVLRGRAATGLSGYLTDGHGNVRIMLSTGIVADANASSTDRYYYRSGEGDQWHPLSINNSNVDDGFRPSVVDAANNRVLGFMKVDGFDTVVAMPLDGSGTGTSIFARPGVEADTMVISGPYRRVVGVSFATNRRQSEYFDPQIATMVRALSRVLGARAVTMVDETTDEGMRLIYAGSDNDAGRYYLFNPAARSLRPLLAVRPQLEGVALSNVRDVQYPAADGTMIPGYLTLPPGRDSAAGLPAIVMPHGGPSSRDEGGFDWLPQFFAAQGYAVLQPNYRGSSGYGDAWYLDNGFQSWRTAVGDVTDAGRWLVAQGADASKLSIVGWSYGGYAALQSGVIAPDLFRAIVAIAPVSDLGQLRQEEGRGLYGRARRDFIGQGPHVADGSPARHAAQITAPVLMFHGTLDTNVDIEQGRTMRRALTEAGKRVELVEYEGLEHSLTTSEARRDMLGRIAAFLPH